MRTKQTGNVITVPNVYKSGLCAVQFDFCFLVYFKRSLQIAFTKTKIVPQIVKETFQVLKYTVLKCIENVTKLF
jgi:hypothetical protein